MIVLAIAGLIMLIVFLAVPALQRNGRNTQRKADAGNISSAVASFLSNNNGTLPIGIGNGTAGSVDVCAAGGTSSGALGAACTAGTNTESSKVGFYPQAQVYINSASTSATPQTVAIAAVGSESTTAVSVQSIDVVLNARCGLSATPGTTAYSARSVAIIYATEAATGNGSLQCTGS